MCGACACDPQGGARVTEAINGKKPIGFAEFVALMAALIAMVAMSIDVILPALAAIGGDLAAGEANDRQLAVTMFILGMAFSQIVYGPLSDSFGRRNAVFLGLGIYLAGTALCLVAESLSVLIAGRIVQGVGAAGPRIIANAIIRDRYSGRPMARVSSLTMPVFIIVPVFAPLLGQVILTVAPWRVIFWCLALFALAILLWAATRLEETLPIEKRLPFRLEPIMQSLWMVLGNRLAVGCTLVMSLTFSAFLAFLSSSQQILGEAYDLGEWFPLAFSSIAVVIGCASAANAALVIRYGMQRLSTIGIVSVAAVSAGYALWSVSIGIPPLWATMLWLAVSMGSIGIVSGNLNAMAMEPLGAVAGVAAGAIGTVTSLISAVLATVIARQYDGTAMPIALGFMACSLVSLMILHWATHGRVRRIK